MGKLVLKQSVKAHGPLFLLIVSTCIDSLQLLGAYPLVAKSLRDIQAGKAGSQHHCGMALQQQGLGYPDLDDLMKSPEPLEFILGMVASDIW